ncbi:MAG: hypothetical protein LBN21_08265 [Treponema sp.]|nr:hypothetical protein [Treponema sp.]
MSAKYSHAGKSVFAQKILFVFTVVCLAIGALSFVGCPLDPDDGDESDELNSGLIGTWFADFGGGYTDTYIVTATTISHPDGWPPYADASIEWVYNFNSGGTAGCIIIKRAEDNKYNAVYFKELTATTVLLGDAYDTTITWPDDTDSSVATLDEAKNRFKPENADTYGGGSAQTGLPQTKE